MFDLKAACDRLALTHGDYAAALGAVADAVTDWEAAGKPHRDATMTATGVALRDARRAFLDACAELVPGLVDLVRPRDLPGGLSAEPLEAAGPEVKARFYALLQDQRNAEELQRTHRCYFYVPEARTWDDVGKRVGNDDCPRCKDGRVFVEIFRDSFCDTWTFKCSKTRHGGCDYEEPVDFDPDLI